MSLYVALLRGINVGKNQRIAMSDLKALLAALGHQDVATLLQSGNAVFAADGGSTDAMAKGIEQAITSELGLDVRCLVREAADLNRVVSANPLRDHEQDGSRLLVTFLSKRPDAAKVASIDPEAFAPEVFAVGRQEIYNWYPEGVRAAKLTYSFFEKKLGVVATARNWNTVTKLLAMTT